MHQIPTMEQKNIDDLAVVGFIRDRQVLGTLIHDFVEWSQVNTLLLNLDKKKELLADFKRKKILV